MKEDNRPATQPSAFLQQVHRHARRSPNRIAQIVVDADGNPVESITYAALQAKARAIAQAVRSAGRNGAPVYVLLPNGPDFTAAYLGCRIAGSTVIPLPYPHDEPAWQTLAPAVRHMTATVGAMTALTDRAFAGRNAATAADRRWLDGVTLLEVDAIPEIPDAEWDGPAEGTDRTTAHVLFTSGTTSASKGVRLSAAAIAHNLTYTADRWNFHAGDRMMALGHAWHSAALMVNFLMPVFRGGSAVILPPDLFRTDPLAFLAAIARQGVTHTACSDTAIAHVMAHARVSMPNIIMPDTWRHAMIGGEPLTEPTWNGIRTLLAGIGAHGTEIRTAYGMTEAAGLITTSGARNPPAAIRIDLAALAEGYVNRLDTFEDPHRFLVGCGDADHGVEIAIVDADGWPISEGRIGEVVLHGPSLFDGYWGEPDVVTPPLRSASGDGGKGFFPTGDYGFVQDGELFILGRKKEAIAVADRLFHPADLEAHIAETHPLPDPAATMVVADGRGGILVLQGVEPFLSTAERFALAESIADASADRMGTVPIRVALVPKEALPRVPTSAKKPRGRARDAHLSGRLPALAERIATRHEHAHGPITSIGSGTSSTAAGSAWRADDFGERGIKPIETSEDDWKALRDAAASAPDAFAINVEAACPTGLRDAVATVRHALTHGPGMALLSGLPTDAEADALRLFCGIGRLLGLPVSQNNDGERVVSVRDVGGPRPLRGYRGRGTLPFHTDTSDVTALLCLAASGDGGETMLISAVSVYDILATETPHHLEPLFRGFRYDRRNEQREGEAPVTPRIPVFSWAGDDLSCRYLRGFIESAADRTGECLSAAEKAALDAFDAATRREALALRLRLHPGQILFVNNYTVLHGRTAFVDRPGTKPRHLLRLWLRLPEFRTLAAPFTARGRAWSSRNGIPPQRH